jgi:hypothetical protein
MVGRIKRSAVANLGAAPILCSCPSSAALHVLAQSLGSARFQECYKFQTSRSRGAPHLRNLVPRVQWCMLSLNNATAPQIIDQPCWLFGVCTALTSITNFSSRLFLSPLNDPTSRYTTCCFQGLRVHASAQTRSSAVTGVQHSCSLSPLIPRP